MKETPIKKEIVDGLIAQLGIQDFAKATIREVKQVAAMAEKESGVEFIKMEMGIPGLPAAQVGVDAQVKALQDGIAHSYPDIQGYPGLKKQASRFVKAFINVDIAPEGCVPVSGSMQGTFASFLTCSQANKQKDTVLFIDPGFPVQKMQLQVQGVKYETFDVYDFRGDKLRPKLESYLSKGNICTIVYSNPNNPAWICMTEDELKTIGELATKYDVIIMEDLAYFAMDFRQDLSKPFEAPYQPTVAHYTDNSAQRGSLYRQLHPAHLRFQGIQLCRRAHRRDVHLRQVVPSPLCRPQRPLRGSALRTGILHPYALCAFQWYQPLGTICYGCHAEGCLRRRL